MKTAKNTATALLALLLCMLICSCNKYNYTEDLQALGKRVEILEETLRNMNLDIEALNLIIATIETNGYVTKVVENQDGTYLITFNNGETITLRDGKKGEDGKDGREIDFHIGVAQDSDGKWYWTMNGNWIVDENGNRMRAGAEDGRDGRDGINDPQHPATPPVVRINDRTRHWEISTDGGITWTDTGVNADGRDGTNGTNGVDDMFFSIVQSPDGKYITFIMTDGSTYTVPALP